MSSGGRARAWLELARVSNLPTCFTNALVGVSLAGGGSALPWTEWAWLCCAVGLLYTGGMFLNDVVDAKVDAASRGQRPIPSGRIGRTTALVAALAALALGTALVGAIRARALPWAGALVACIVVYDLVHKRVAASVLLMGSCRGLVYVMCACAAGPVAHPRVLASIAVAMTLYVVALTILARREDAGELRARGLELVLPALVLAPTAITGPHRWPWLIAAAGAVLLWLLASLRFVWRAPIEPPRAVMAWLAGICLADAYFLALLGERLAVVVAWACFAVTVAGHRRILGT